MQVSPSPPSSPCPLTSKNSSTGFLWTLSCFFSSIFPSFILSSWVRPFPLPSALQPGPLGGLASAATCPLGCKGQGTPLCLVAPIPTALCFGSSPSRWAVGSSVTQAVITPTETPWWSRKHDRKEGSQRWCCGCPHPHPSAECHQQDKWNTSVAPCPFLCWLHLGTSLACPCVQTANVSKLCYGRNLN